MASPLVLSSIRRGTEWNKDFLFVGNDGTTPISDWTDDDTLGVYLVPLTNNSASRTANSFQIDPTKITIWASEARVGLRLDDVYTSGLTDDTYGVEFIRTDVDGAKTTQLLAEVSIGSGLALVVGGEVNTKPLDLVVDSIGTYVIRSGAIVTSSGISPKGDPGLTPEERTEILDAADNAAAATTAANNAATIALEAKDEALQAAEDAESAATNANQSAGLADQAVIQMQQQVSSALSTLPTLGVVSATIATSSPIGTAVGVFPNNYTYTLADDAAGRVKIQGGQPVMAVVANAAPEDFTYVLNAVPLGGGMYLKWAVNVAVRAVLQTLTLDQTSIFEYLTTGQVAANFGGKFTGSTITISKTSLVAVGAQLQRSAVSIINPEVMDFDAVETLAGAVNSPKTTHFSLTVRNLPTLTVPTANLEAFWDFFDIRYADKDAIGYTSYSLVQDLATGRHPLIQRAKSLQLKLGANNGGLSDLAGRRLDYNAGSLAAGIANAATRITVCGRHRLNSAGYTGANKRCLFYMSEANGATIRPDGSINQFPGSGSGAARLAIYASGGAANHRIYAVVSILDGAQRTFSITLPPQIPLDQDFFWTFALDCTGAQVMGTVQIGTGTPYSESWTPAEGSVGNWSLGKSEALIVCFGDDASNTAPLFGEVQRVGVYSGLLDSSARTAAMNAMMGA